MEENREYPKKSIGGHGNDIGDGFDQEIERGRSENDNKLTRRGEARRARVLKKREEKDAKGSEQVLSKNGQASKETKNTNDTEERRIEPSAKNLPCEISEAKHVDDDKGQKGGEVINSRGVTGVGRICLIFATFCFVCGILILGAVIGSGKEDDDGALVGNTEGGGVSEENESEPPVMDDEKTEKKYLSKAEIYSENIDGIVSISSETDGGTGIGTGFFVSGDGYVATAAHVIENAQRVWVILASGKRVEARVIAENEFSDVALLKVAGDGYKALTFGDSEALTVGDTVTAIGTPASLEYAGSLSSGEVSYNGRILKMYDSSGALIKKMKVIQTNAQVNPGNSGCPLFNDRGEVVGMVSMKLGREYEGLGFALPAHGVKTVIEAMMAGDELDFDILSGVAIPVPRLGISGAEYSMGDVSGVEIVGFANDEQGAVKVLKVGDVITEIDGEEIGSISEISEVIGKYRPSDKVSVTVYRKGQYLTFSVVLY